MLIACRKDHLNFKNMTQPLIGGVIVDKLANEFEVLFSFREAHARIQSYSYQENFELHILAKEMIALELPTPY